MNRPPKTAIVRLTLNVNLDAHDETAFLRVVLTRLNVLNAQTKPDVLKDILKGSRLREHFEKKQKEKYDAAVKPTKPHYHATSHTFVKNTDDVFMCQTCTPSHPIRNPLPVGKPACEECTTATPGVHTHSHPITPLPTVIPVKHEPPKITWAIKAIKEKRMPLPFGVLDMLGGA